MRGVVTEFSHDRGLGTVTSDGGDTYVFHVVEIADGTRAIEVGTEVAFRALPKFGAIEAADLVKGPPSGR